MKGLFLRAQENKMKLEMFYMDDEGSLTQRTIRVLRVSKESILAYCYERKEVRSFKQENILSAGPLRGKVGA
ncbi:hypothetical protein SAMN05421743_105237 [Thalassobacillus cyri]|uniref:WYL domain-containing protein n=1 Tax=Thalassobacillus cyri TaxID=571932 RepID=A0A1H4C235_9BACI|nr:hypothetical protein [Thalassobacillus cyri]SEA54505.1 hypothetical protein SAMN05421743_105237 [Thalassobacillus cyri]